MMLACDPGAQVPRRDLRRGADEGRVLAACHGGAVHELQHEDLAVAAEEVVG